MAISALLFGVTLHYTPKRLNGNVAVMPVVFYYEFDKAFLYNTYNCFININKHVCNYRL